jgi:ankyrin repeat protein
LKADESVVNEGDHEYGQSPLSWACEYESLSVVKTLLEFDKLDPKRRATGWKNRTPLHFAAIKENKEIIKALLDDSRHDLDVEALDEDNTKALDYAVIYANGEITTLLFRDRRTSHYSRIKCMRAILKFSPALRKILGAMLTEMSDNDLNDSELLCLMRDANDAAAHQCFRTFAERMMERPQSKARLSNLLLLAASGPYSEVINRLIDLDVDPTLVDEDGWTCTDVAASQGQTEIQCRLEDYLARKPRPADNEPASPKLLNLRDPQSDNVIQIIPTTGNPGHMSKLLTNTLHTLPYACSQIQTVFTSGG